MSLSLFVPKAVVCSCLVVAAPMLVSAQATYSPQAREYALTGVLPGDQVRPQLALSTTGGYAVWEDNITDGYGLGVSMMRLDSSFSPALSPQRINVTLQGDQNRPQVSLLKGGGAAFVWQGGRQGFQQVYARFLNASNVFATGEVLINGFTNFPHHDPVVATLANSNVVVIYNSYNQASSNSLQDVYGQILTPTGQKVGSEFLVNNFTSYNQRNPSVAALSDGRFVVVWVTEQQRAVATPGTTNSPVYGTASVDVMARLFTAAGAPATTEIWVNTSSDICSTPRVAAASDGSFMVVWSEQDRMSGVNSIDIWSRVFTSAGIGGASRCANTTRRGDQFAPTVAADAGGYLVAWTGLAQDGSYEGVFGQFFHLDGTVDGTEFQANTTWISHQIQPVAASDGQGRFLVAWSSFGGGANSYDLFAQRYVNTATPLPAMDPPFVYVPFQVINDVYTPQLQVSWPVQAGFSVDHYELFVNGSPTAAVSLTTNFWLMTSAQGLTAGSTNFFQVAFVTSAGRRSPLSGATYARTWSGNNNWGGIPSDWMTAYYGPNMFNWPRPDALVGPGGPTVLQAFLTGANPFDPSTWLRTRMMNTPTGAYVTWNPQPGLVYQVQTSSDLRTWTNLGSPRLAASNMDSYYVGGANVGYYRVLRLR